MLWGNTPWDGHHLGAQSIAEALSAHHDVLYVDPPTSIVRQWRIGVREIGRRLRGRSIDPISDGLMRLRTIGPPGLRRRGGRTVNNALLRRTVRAAVESLDRPVRAVISGYLDVDPWGICEERWRICRVSDDFSVGGELGVDVSHMADAQRRIAERSDAIVCVSPRLADTWRTAARPTAMIPNGADVEGFRGAADLERPAEIDLPDPIVGYVGQLSTRIDLELVRSVASSGHSLLLVGRIREDLDRALVDDLLGFANVQWVEPVPYDEVPAYVGAMAIGLLPYSTSAFNLASFPLKVFDYLATGIAVVSTDLPAVRWIDSDHILVADGPEAFAAAVDIALGDIDDPTSRADRRALAAEHSWPRRAEAYISLLDELDEAAGAAQSSGP